MFHYGIFNIREEIYILYSWDEFLLKKIDIFTDSIGVKISKTLKIYDFINIIKRIDQFYISCQTCNKLKSKVF